MRHFHTSNINWTKFKWVLTGILGAWVLTVEIVPTNIYKIVSVALAVLSFLVGYFMSPTNDTTDKIEIK